MIEAKDKEQAVFHLYRIYDLAPTIHGKLLPLSPHSPADRELTPPRMPTESLRPPAEEETLQTAGRKSNKAKSPKKGKKGEVVGTDEIKAGDPNEEVKVEAAVEEGVAPLPEGKDAEGQAYSPPVDPENVQALQEQEQQAKPKKRVAGRSQKAKEVEPVAGDEPKPKKQRRAPKKKAAAIPTEPMQTDDSAAPA
jgi:UV DNA damage endonuclease